MALNILYSCIYLSPFFCRYLDCVIDLLPGLDSLCSYRSNDFGFQRSDLAPINKQHGHM